MHFDVGLPRRIPLLLMMLVGSLVAARAVAQDDMPNAALATRLETIARQTLDVAQPSPADFRAAAAMMEAAGRLDPDEPRYRRLRAEALRRAGDVDRAIEALAEYRQLRPDDHLAQVDQIDLYLSTMNTADARADYLRQVVEAESLPETVRSYAAALAARELRDRGQSADAEQMLARALKLNPLNQDALRLRLASLPLDDVPGRVAALLALLRANPNQPLVMLDLGRTAGEAGLVEESLEWSRGGLDLLTATGGVPHPQDVVDYAAMLLIAGRASDAQALADELHKRDPDDPDAWFIKLIAARRSAQADQAIDAPLLDGALGSLRARADALFAEVSGEPAATRDAAPIEPAALLGFINTGGRDDLIDDFVSIASDIAWFQLYFRAQPADAEPWIAALEDVLPGDSVTLVRLKGWQLLRGGHPEEALAALEPIADRDAMGALGAIESRRAIGATDEEVRPAAEQALRDHASGLAGATAHAALASLNFELAPTDQMIAVREQIAAFPQRWLQVIAQPQNVYSLRVEPKKVVHVFGEPILLNVRIYNGSDHPITIGRDGVIRPELWVNAELRGGGEDRQMIPGAAFDEIAGPLVLAPRKAITHTVRIDHGPLDAILFSRPMAALYVEPAVISNPTTIEAGVVPGAAGHEARSARIVQRHPARMTSEQEAAGLRAAYEAGGAEQKIDLLHLAAALVQTASTAETSPAMRAAAAQLRELVERATTSADPNVAAWAGYLLIDLGQPDQAGARIAELAKSPTWQAKMLALAAARTRPVESALGRDVAAATDDNLVQRYADAIETLANQSTPAPATMPSTAPVGE